MFLFTALRTLWPCDDVIWAGLTCESEPLPPPHIQAELQIQPLSPAFRGLPGWRLQFAIKDPRLPTLAW